MAKRNRYFLTSLLAAVVAGMPAAPRTQWRCVGHVVPQHCSRRSGVAAAKRNKRQAKR